MTVEWPGEGDVILQRLYNDVTSSTKDHSAYAQIEHMKFLFGKKELRDIINSVEFMRFYFDCAPDVSNFSRLTFFIKMRIFLEKISIGYYLASSSS